MGYTHYYDQPERIKPETFARMRHDIQRIVEAVQEAGLPLAGWNGTDKPNIEVDRITLNGQEHCGHAPATIASLEVDPNTQPGIAFRWSDANEPLIVDGDGIRYCDGDCSHESFVLLQNCTPRVTKGDPSLLTMGFTKTNHKPYDFVVTAALIVAKRHLGSVIQVDSDGGDKDWEDARQICQAVLGYGREYHLGDTGLEANPELAEVPTSALAA